MYAKHSIEPVQSKATVSQCHSQDKCSVQSGDSTKESHRYSSSKKSCNPDESPEGVEQRSTLFGIDNASTQRKQLIRDRSTMVSEDTLSQSRSTGCSSFNGRRNFMRRSFSSSDRNDLEHESIPLTFTQSSFAASASQTSPGMWTVVSSEKSCSSDMQPSSRLPSFTQSSSMTTQRRKLRGSSWIPDASSSESKTHSPGTYLRTTSTRNDKFRHHERGRARRLSSVSPRSHLQPTCTRSISTKSDGLKVWKSTSDPLVYVGNCHSSMTTLTSSLTSMSQDSAHSFPRIMDGERAREQETAVLDQRSTGPPKTIVVTPSSSSCTIPHKERSPPLWTLNASVSNDFTGIYEGSTTVDLLAKASQVKVKHEILSSSKQRVSCAVRDMGKRCNSIANKLKQKRPGHIGPFTWPECLTRSIGEHPLDINNKRNGAMMGIKTVQNDNKGICGLGETAKERLVCLFVKGETESGYEVILGENVVLQYINEFNKLGNPSVGTSLTAAEKTNKSRLLQSASLKFKSLSSSIGKAVTMRRGREILQVQVDQSEQHNTAYVRPKGESIRGKEVKKSKEEKKYFCRVACLKNQGSGKKNPSEGHSCSKQSFPSFATCFLSRSKGNVEIQSKEKVWRIEVMVGMERAEVVLLSNS